MTEQKVENKVEQLIEDFSDALDNSFWWSTFVYICLPLIVLFIYFGGYTSEYIQALILFCYLFSVRVGLIVFDYLFNKIKNRVKNILKTIKT